MKVAMAQMLVEPGKKEANIARAEAVVVAAARRGADIVVLPEAMNLGWTDPSGRTDSDEIPAGPAYRKLAQSAQNEKVFVCAGIIERSGEKVFNSAVLIAPTGELILHHRKINELGMAHDLYDRGDRVGVVETPFGRIGLMICADAFAPAQVISRTLGMMGARYILSPCSWAVPADYDNIKEPYGKLWLDNYCPVAQDHNLFIVGVSNVGPITAGPWAGRKCIGNSLLIGPNGAELARGPYGERCEALLLRDLTA